MGVGESPRRASGAVATALDDDHVVRVLVLAEQHAVARHHVVNYVALADLFRAERLRRREVLAVVVAQVVVAHNRHRLDARTHEEADDELRRLSLARATLATNDHRL